MTVSIKRKAADSPSPQTEGSRAQLDVQRIPERNEHRERQALRSVDSLFSGL